MKGSQHQRQTRFSSILCHLRVLVGRRRWKIACARLASRQFYALFEFLSVEEDGKLHVPDWLLVNFMPSSSSCRPSTGMQNPRQPDRYRRCLDFKIAMTQTKQSRGPWSGTHITGLNKVGPGRHKRPAPHQRNHWTITIPLQSPRP